MSKQEFKLRQDLEALVKFAGVSKELSEVSKRKFDNGLIDSAKNFYGNLRNAGITQFDPLTFEAMTHCSFSNTMEDGHQKVLLRLKDRIDDETYNKARSFYLNELDEQLKLSFYLTMLSDGMMPNEQNNADEKTKKSFKALKEAKEELDLAKAIEDAVASGNIDLADQLISDKLDAPTLRYLDRLGLYGGPAFRNAEKSIYLDVANARKGVAAQKIKDNKLYGLIDKGIKENELGKAYSLMGMYGAYQAQLKVNEAKKKQEKKK